MNIEKIKTLYVSEEKDCVYTANDFKEYLANERKQYNLTPKEVIELKESYTQMNFSKLVIGKKYSLEELDLEVLKGIVGYDKPILTRFGAFDIMGLDEILEKKQLLYYLTESFYLELTFKLNKLDEENEKKSIVELVEINLE